MSKGCNTLLKEITNNNYDDPFWNTISLNYFIDVEHDTH